MVTPEALPNMRVESTVGAPKRVGVSKAADWPNRFYVRVRASSFVSRPDGWGIRQELVRR